MSASDHLHGETPTYEPWTLLSWIAAETSRVSVLTRVLAVPYRAPAVVAKMAETLDRLSNGRLILGLGAGYLDAEFQAFGLRVPSLREKIDGMEEAVGLIRRLWSEPSVSFRGRQYQADEARLEPRPRHHIPIWLGTYGPRALAITGRMADGWIPSLGFAPPDKVRPMLDRVRRAAEDAGRDPREVHAIYNVTLRLADHRRARPPTVSGPPADVVDRLIELARLGFNGFNLIPAGPNTTAQIERLGNEVLPAVRTALDDLVGARSSEPT